MQLAALYFLFLFSLSPIQNQVLGKKQQCLVHRNFLMTHLNRSQVLLCIDLNLRIILLFMHLVISLVDLRTLMRHKQA